MRAQQPDFFLHMGDTIYADRNGAARSLEEFWSKYRINRDDAAAQSCFRETSVYVMWDDHEVENDYLPGHPLARVVRKAFLEYWPVRRPAGEAEQIYRAVSWGRAVDLIILDTRQYRGPDRSTMLGQRQKEWFFDRLAGVDMAAGKPLLLAEVLPAAAVEARHPLVGAEPEIAVG